MLRFIKVVYNKAHEGFVKIVGIITLVFSFILTFLGKNDISKSHSVTYHNIKSSVMIDVSHIESASYKNVFELYFKSSVTITISKIEVKVGKFTDELSGDSLTQYENNQWHIMGGYEGVEPGQIWEFTFYGNEVELNKEFVITTEYVVN